jgi:hypothetical protein
MTDKNTTRPKQASVRVPNGHGYCWAQGPSGARCIHPKGHSGKHYDPYVSRREW